MALTDPIAIPAACGCCQDYDLGGCRLCTQNGPGNPAVTPTSVHAIYATVAGFVDDIQSKFPAAYAAVFGLLVAPLHPRVNGSYLCDYPPAIASPMFLRSASQYGGTVPPGLPGHGASLSVGKQLPGDPAPSGLYLTQLNAFEQVWNQETPGCGYSNPWPIIYGPAGRSVNFDAGRVDEFLVAYLGCPQAGASGQVYVPVMVRYFITIQMSLSNGVSVVRNYARTSVVERPIAAVACSPFLLATDSSTTGPSPQFGNGLSYNGAAVTLLDPFAGSILCFNSQAFVSEPFGGTLTFSE